MGVRVVLILADEPTGNLDQETGQRVISSLLALKESGVTIVVVTHDELVASYCERTIPLVDGRVSDS